MCLPPADGRHGAWCISADPDPDLDVRVVASLATPLAADDGVATCAAAARILSVLAKTPGRPSAKIASHLARTRSASALFACLQQAADQRLFFDPASRAKTSKLLEALLRALSAIWQLMGPLVGLSDLRNGAGPGPYIPVWGDEEDDGLPGPPRRSARDNQHAPWTPGFYPYVAPNGAPEPGQCQAEWMLLRGMLAGQLDTYAFPANLRLLLSCVFLGDPIIESITVPNGDHSIAPPPTSLPRTPCTKAREYACCIVADLFGTRYDKDLVAMPFSPLTFRTAKDLAARYGIGIDDPQRSRAGWRPWWKGRPMDGLPRDRQESVMLRDYILTFDPLFGSAFPRTPLKTSLDIVERPAGRKRELPSDSESSDRPARRAKQDGGSDPFVEEDPAVLADMGFSVYPLQPDIALCKWIQANLSTLPQSPLQDAMLDILESLLVCLLSSPCSPVYDYDLEVTLPPILRSTLVKYHQLLDDKGKIRPRLFSPSRRTANDRNRTGWPGLEILLGTQPTQSESSRFLLETDDPLNQWLRGPDYPLVVQAAAAHRFALDPAPISGCTVQLAIEQIGRIDTRVSSLLRSPVSFHTPVPATLVEDDDLSPDAMVVLLLRQQEGLLRCLARPLSYPGPNSDTFGESRSLRIPASVLTSPSLGVRAAAAQVYSSFDSSLHYMCADFGELPTLLSGSDPPDVRRAQLFLAPGLVWPTLRAISLRWGEQGQFLDARDKWIGYTDGDALLTLLCRAVKAIVRRPSNKELVFAPYLAKQDIRVLAMKLVYHLYDFLDPDEPTGIFPAPLEHAVRVELGRDTVMALTRCNHPDGRIRSQAIHLAEMFGWIKRDAP